MALLRPRGQLVALAAAAIALAPLAATTESSFTLELSERPGPKGQWSILPAEIKGPDPGDVLTLTVKNTGNTVHNLSLEAHPMGGVKELLSPGDERTVTFDVPKVGKFAYWCDVPGHRQQGMEGQLVVGKFPTGVSAAPGPGAGLVVVALGVLAILMVRKR